MTNQDKRELRQMCKDGWSFEDIRDCVDCCDATIKSYLKIFNNEDNISLCKKCFCMTKTIDEKCGKCKEKKDG